MKRRGLFTRNLFQTFTAFLFVCLCAFLTAIDIKTEPPQSQAALSPSFSVDKSGIVTTRASGTATVTAMMKDKTVSVQVVAPKPGPAKIEVRPETASGLVGDDIRLNAVAVDAKGKERTDLTVDWKSGNPAVAAVNADGIVSLKAAGTVTIVASAEGKTASAVLTVANPPTAKVDVRPAVAALFVGETKQLEAVAVDAKNGEQKDPAATWQTGSPSIASVSNNGLVTANAVGSAVITAAVGSITSSPVTVTVKAKESSSLKLLQDELRTRLRGKDPSELIYLSGITGEIAGTGDPTKFAGDAEQAGLSQHPLALELAELPKDRYGLIDWATAIKTEKVKPRYSIDPKAGADEVPFQLDVVVFTKSQFMPDVIFPHFVHTLWLTCTNCHPAIFPMNAKEANRTMTMPRIASGEFCGRCHNRVAFPLSDCLRCHVKPKEMPPVDPDYQAQNKARMP
ncbi:MAG: Ig-like domain-containing protein [Nitrospirae bacterium]|nr:Ig-like domain-containing protein [Nitrospirota bacterium]